MNNTATEFSAESGGAVAGESAEPEPDQLRSCCDDTRLSMDWTIIEDCPWPSGFADAVRQHTASITRFFSEIYAASHADLPAYCHTEVMLSNDQHITALNQTWRDKNSATNVLSFSTPQLLHLPDQPLELGCIVLAQETISREASEIDIPLLEHTLHLLVHGLLHLLGHDHQLESERLDMEQWEIRAMAFLGYESPYA